MVLSSLKSRIRREFEVSAAEVDHQDLLQRAALAVAAVGPDQAPLDALMQKVLTFMERNFDGEILSFENEFIHFCAHSSELTARAVRLPVRLSAVSC